jgi:tRNA(fMet)-specific endonuclease VapC
MAGSRLVLDTNIIVQVFKKNSITRQKIEAIESLMVPLTVVGELLFGAYKSERLAKHLEETTNFLAQCAILYPDEITAEIYGRTKATLAKKGRPIPDNDIWIAAVALQHKLPLYTSDSHFREVDGLLLFNPLNLV